MEGESGVTRSIIEGLHSLDNHRDQMEDESGVSRSIFDELHSSDIQGDQMAGDSGVTRSIIDELHSWDIEGDQMVVKEVLLEVSLINFILSISNEIKGKMKVVLLQKSWMNLSPWIS